MEPSLPRTEPGTVFLERPVPGVVVLQQLQGPVGLGLTHWHSKSEKQKIIRKSANGKEID